MDEQAMCAECRTPHFYHSETDVSSAVVTLQEAVTWVNEHPEFVAQYVGKIDAIKAFRRLHRKETDLDRLSREHAQMRKLLQLADHDNSLNWCDEDWHNWHTQVSQFLTSLGKE